MCSIKISSELKQNIGTTECFRMAGQGFAQGKHNRVDPHMCSCTLGAVAVSNGLHRRVPAVASSPRASEHIGTHGLFSGQRASQSDGT